jgi:hypothetical protein
VLGEKAFGEALGFPPEDEVIAELKGDGVVRATSFCGKKMNV